MADKMIVDLTNYKDRFGQHVEPGTYNVSVVDAEMDESRAGNQMVNVYLSILDDGPEKGATLVDRLHPNNPKAQFRFVAFMRAIGKPVERKRFELNLRALVGKVLEVEVADGEPYNGNVRSEIRAYNRSDMAKTAPARDLGDDLDEDEEISDEPTDYDEDVEPQKVRAAAKKKAEKRAEVDSSAKDEQDTDDDPDVDLDDLEDL